MNFLQLNEDCKLAIFSHLPLNQRLHQRVVCQEWCNLIETQLYSQKVLHLVDSTIHPGWNEEMLPQNDQEMVPSNTIVLKRGLPQELATVLCELFPSVRHLYIHAFVRGCKLPFGISNLIAHWAPQLETISINIQSFISCGNYSANSGHPIWYFLSTCSSLKSLDLSMCFIDQSAFTTLKPILVRLSELSIRFYGDNWLQFFTLPESSSLTSLRLNLMSGDRRRLDMASTIHLPSSLTNLAVSYQYCNADQFPALVDRFSQVDSITELEFEFICDHFNEQFTIKIQETLARFSHLQSFKTMATLFKHLNMTFHDDPERVRPLFHRFITIDRLVLFKGYLFEPDNIDSYLGTMARHLPNLRRLEFISTEPERILSRVIEPAKAIFGEQFEVTATYTEKHLYGQYKEPEDEVDVDSVVFFEEMSISSRGSQQTEQVEVVAPAAVGNRRFRNVFKRCTIV